MRCFPACGRGERALQSDSKNHHIEGSPMPRFKSLAAALGLLVVTAAASADINIGVIVSLTRIGG